MNLGNQGQTEKLTGDLLPVSFGEYAEVLETQLEPRYCQQTYRGQKFFYSATNLWSITTYTGNAGGTPFVGLWNPSYTGKNLILQHIFAASYSYGGNVVTCPVALYGGPTNAITAASSNPTNALTLITSGNNGSTVRCYTTTVLSGSSALAYICSATSFYTVATGTGIGSSMPATIYDVGGAIVIPPGSALALGGPVSGTDGGYYDLSLWWNEVPV
jgi:hypothetical protein